MVRRRPRHSVPPSTEPRGKGDLPNVAVEDEGLGEGTNTKIRVASRPPTSSKRDRPYLLVVAGKNVGEMFPLRERQVVIGRSQKAAIRIDDDGVSRRHARLMVSEGEVRLEDLGSANGTFVNGTAVRSARLLEDGDKLSVGGATTLKFTYSDELDVVFQRRMLEAALRDGLTGAYNKRYLMERLETELAFAIRHGVPLSLLMLDVDHFKRINDTFGHPAGDDVLVALARVVQSTIRKEDVFARYGGEEFAVVCRSVDPRSAGVLAERLRERIGSTVIEHEGERIPVTVSVGVAGLPGAEAESPTELVAAADEALYEAKRSGRNRVVTSRAS